MKLQLLDDVGSREIQYDYTYEYTSSYQYSDSPGDPTSVPQSAA